MTFPWPRIWLTIGALLPYWQFLTLKVVYVTDDIFASDIFNGELPVRALTGRLLRGGDWPVWTSELCSGLPLAGTPADPLGLILFAFLPTAPALDLYLIALLLIAAHGSYGLARRFGADAAGGILAGLAFAGSGYIAAQLKHLTIISTVVWLPIGVLLVDRVMDPDTRPAKRSLWAALFAAVFAQQALSGFPQSAYICALVYGAFTLFRAAATYRRFVTRAVTPLALLAAAVVIGAAAGAVVLLPLSALAEVSDRAAVADYGWSTHLAYWPPNLLQFLIPYVHGDISNATYLGNSIFWEDYGYVGILTFVLAIYAAIRDWQRAIVKFLVGLTTVAMLFVLGRWTLVYYVAYVVLPGLSTFRFPTRFLIVVELGLALLAAIGLTRARQELERGQPGTWAVRLVPAAIVLFTIVDLTYHQPRQNAVVPAEPWLAAPPAVAAIQADTPQPRTFTPRHRALHREAFNAAKGWSDVTPYFELRGVLEPNTGAGFWNVASADCYAGISARWTIDVWGDHNRDESLVSRLASLDVQNKALLVEPAFSTVMRTYGVTHVLSPYPQKGNALSLLQEDPGALVYRVDGAARARFVGAGRAVVSEQEAATRLLDAQFDPDREVLLHDAAAVPAAGAEAPALQTSLPGSTVRIEAEGPASIDIAVDAATAGYLLLTDTYYPGWSATIDGAPATIVRANISSRAVAVPAGRHEVRMTYEAPGFATGSTISIAAIALLLVWLAASLVATRRAPL